MIWRSVRCSMRDVRRPKTDMNQVARAWRQWKRAWTISSSTWLQRLQLAGTEWILLEIAWEVGRASWAAFQKKMRILGNVSLFFHIFFHIWRSSGVVVGRVPRCNWSSIWYACFIINSPFVAQVNMSLLGTCGSKTWYWYSSSTFCAISSLPNWLNLCRSHDCVLKLKNSATFNFFLSPR